jgi:hypothetical protein
MKPEDLVLGKVYVYDNTECLVFDKFPSSGCFGLETFKFQTVGVPNPKPRWLNAEAVNDLITELEIEKPEVSNFRQVNGCMTKELVLQTIAMFLLSWLYCYAFSKKPWLSVITATFMALLSVISYYFRKK